MGMFTKDKEIGRELVTAFAEREEFILHSVRVEPEAVQTDFGMADKSILTVSKVGDSNNTFEVTSLAGAIADKCKQADENEFPAIVCWLTVQSKKHGKSATVIQFIREA
jgi:hypothetical protein